MNNNLPNLSELATRESAIVEWKENVADVADIIETIVAFANDFLNLGGGYIVCGAKEAKDENGFQTVIYIGLTANRLKEVKERVITDCTNSTRVNPPINPKVDELEVPNDLGRRILVFTIDATSEAHTYKRNKDDAPNYFIRTDFNTKKASNGFIRDLLKRKGRLESWDKRINLKTTVADIDELVLRQYLQKMRLWSTNKSIADYLSDREKIEEFIPPLLGSSGFEKPLHPKNFTLMVFGKNPIDYCDGAYSIFTIFEGNDKSKHSEMQWITGTVVEQANKLIELLNIESMTAIDKGAENVNQVKYPMIALKEAVVNAVVHRDYEINDPIRVEVYSDRIEIYSPGGLPFNLDKNKFKEGNAKASWRNQAFGRIFHNLNLAQHQGSGIGKIITSMHEEGCPNPIFEVEDGSITCILPAHPRHRIMKKISEAESNIVIRDYLSAFKKLKEVLDQDIYNYRALELFCEVNNLLNSPENILELLLSKTIDYQQIRSNTLVVVSETLSLVRHDKRAELLSKELLGIALSGRLEERQLIKVALTLKKLGDDKAIVDFVNNIIQQYPNLSTNSLLLDQKGRALIDLAKRCDLSFNKNTSDRIRNKAKDDFEKYISEAQKVLRIAFENSTNGVDKDYISKALNYIETDMFPFLTGEKKSGPNQRTVVAHFPNSASENDVRGLFSTFGQIRIITFGKGKIDTKIVFIEFFDDSSAEKALADGNNLMFDGFKIATTRYRTKDDII